MHTHSCKLVHSLARCQGIQDVFAFFADCGVVGPHFKDTAYMYAKFAVANLHMIVVHSRCCMICRGSDFLAVKWLHAEEW